MLAAKGEKGDQMPALTRPSFSRQPYPFWLLKLSRALPPDRRDGTGRRHPFSVVGSTHKHTRVGFLLLLQQVTKTQWFKQHHMIVLSLQMSDVQSEFYLRAKIQVGWALSLWGCQGRCQHLSSFQGPSPFLGSELTSHHLFSLLASSIPTPASLL